MPKVDLANYSGREQAYIKHCLLEEYLPQWAYKVGSKWDSLIYIDGFAGPWGTKHPQYSDSSFGVAIDALYQCKLGTHQNTGRQINIHSVLIEENKSAFAELKKFAASKTSHGFGVHCLAGEFIDQIAAIDNLIKKTAKNPFKFVFLDPKGWSDIPMQKIQPLLKNRSCEVLINLMTRHIVRFLDQPSRADSYNELFGRPEVLNILKNTPSDNNERAEKAVQEYCRSLKQLCDFKYVSSAVILEPNKESVRYYLVYATNHPKGVQVFKDAEMKAAHLQDNVRYETQIQKTRQPEIDFGLGTPRSPKSNELRSHYLGLARKKVVEILSANNNHQELPYSDLFCESMGFPLVTPDDLENWLRKWEPNVRIELSSPRRKKPSPLENDKVIIVNPSALCV